MSAKATFTPWARNALQAAGIDRFVLVGRIPDGWHLNGHAGGSRGPFTFTARNRETTEEHTFTAYSVSEVPIAVENALASMGSDDLESVLAASLAAVEAKA